MDEKERSQQEMEYILDGITTRMQMAMESITKTSKDATDKMAESNRILKSCIIWMCVVTILSLLIMACGFIIDHQLSKQPSQPRTAACEVMANETLSELG